MLHKRDNNEKRTSYISELFAKEDSHLKDTLQSIVDNSLRPINIGPDEAKIVQILLKLHGSKKIIEVGTLAGYSAIWMARAIPRDGKVITFEKDDRTADIARRNINNSDVAKKIEVIVGDAHEKLRTVESKGPFDAIFIDAEKSGYCNYLNWAEKYVRSGGLIIGDNTFLFGQVYDDEAAQEKYAKEIPVMKEFNRRLADEKKYEGVIIPTTEGMTVAIKKF